MSSRLHCTVSPGQLHAAETVKLTLGKRRTVVRKHPKPSKAILLWHSCPAVAFLTAAKHSSVCPLAAVPISVACMSPGLHQACIGRSANPEWSTWRSSHTECFSASHARRTVSWATGTATGQQVEAAPPAEADQASAALEGSSAYVRGSDPS